MLSKNSVTSSDLSLQAQTAAARGLSIWNSNRKPSVVRQSLKCDQKFKNILSWAVTDHVVLKHTYHSFLY